MAKLKTTEFMLTVIPGIEVNAAWDAPKGENVKAAVILAHGAANDYNHHLLTAVSRKLAKDLFIATMRFNFPYRQEGKSNPDPMDRLAASYKAACIKARGDFPGVPIIFAGKSLGARTAAQSAMDLKNAKALLFLGYPLHGPGKFDDLRVDPLPKLKIPMLFLQGDHDPFCRPDLLHGILPKLHQPTMLTIENAGHSYEPKGPKGLPEDRSAALAADLVAQWIGKLV